MNFDCLFEVSNEAGKKVGGIYTVLRSKSYEMVAKLKDRYYLIGRYDEHSENGEFVRTDVPHTLTAVFEELEQLGIKCYYGKWLEGNNANLILVDAWNFNNNLNSIKKFLWDKYSVDSLFMKGFFDENVLWAYAAGIVIEQISRSQYFYNKRVVAHFHEWISGAGLLYLHANYKRIALVFTTHATSLGRTLSSFGKDLIYEAEHNTAVNEQEAYKYKLEGQHFIEKACANNAHVFTTVSIVTGEESGYILGKKPDIITPNAFDFDKFGDITNILKLHKVNRDKVYTFLRSYFMPYYPVKVYHSPIFYLSGRYEVKDKGIDFFIDALAKLNNELKNEHYPDCVFAFIFVPSNVSAPHKEVVSNFNIFNLIDVALEEALEDSKDMIIKRLMFSEEYGKVNIDKSRIPEEKRKELLTVGTFPPIAAFQLNYADDLIIKMCNEKGLMNKVEDKVKLIFYPTYLGENDGLLNTGYYEIISGLDIGVFPSRYEPWGYTPIESAAFANIAFTTDHSGYGRFLLDKNLGNSGIKVIEINNNSYETTVDSICSKLKELCYLSRGELEKLKLDARKTAELSNWKDQVVHYFNAYNLAVSRAKQNDV